MQIFALLSTPEEFFDLSASDDTSQLSALRKCATRWNEHLQSGRFQLSVPLDTPLGAAAGAKADFWCTAAPFDQLVGTELLEDLKRAELVIFKGDLNYRKLTADLQWSTTTSFDESLGELNGHLNLLSLRTCKADVCVGLAEGKAEELDRKAQRWRVSGEYAVISFSKRTKQ